VSSDHGSSASPFPLIADPHTPHHSTRETLRVDLAQKGARQSDFRIRPPCGQGFIRFRFRCCGNGLTSTQLSFLDRRKVSRFCNGPEKSTCVIRGADHGIAEGRLKSPIARRSKRNTLGERPCSSDFFRNSMIRAWLSSNCFWISGGFRLNTANAIETRNE